MPVVCSNNGASKSCPAEITGEQTELSAGQEEPVQEERAVRLQPSEYNPKLLTDGMLFYQVVSEEKHTMQVMGGSDNCMDIVIPLLTESDGQKYQVVSVQYRAFMNHTGLRSVVVPAGIEFIGKHAFAGSAISSATIGCGSIGLNAFEKCGNLSDLTLNEGVERINDEAFINCDLLREVHCPNTLKSIGSKAFRRLSNLTTVTLGDGLESIGERVFEDCKSLETVRFGSGLQQIGTWAFINCSHLQEVLLPTGLKSIGNSAFEGCKSMSRLQLPEGVQSIGSGAFSRCEMLEHVNIPSGIQTLEGGVFSECKSLSSVRLPQDLTVIPRYFFGGCSNLKEIAFPNGLGVVGESAFFKTGLERIDLPEGVEELESDAFSYCPLKEVTLPSTIKKISCRAFVGCDSVETVRCKAVQVPKVSEAFFNTPPIGRKATLYVPASAIDAYSTTKPWDEFRDITSL